MLKIRSWTNNFSISQLSGLFTALVVLICGTLLVSVQYYQIRHHLIEQDQLNQARSLSQLGVTLIPSMIADDRISLNLIVNEWPKPDGLMGLRIENTRQQTVAELGDMVGSHAKAFNLPIQQGQQVLGQLSALVSHQHVENQAKRYFAISMLMVAILSGISSLLSYLITGPMSLYIRQLRQRLINWQTGDPLNLPERQLGSSDFANLHQTLDEIADNDGRKRALESALGQFMSGQNDSRTALQYYDCAMIYLEIQDLHILQSRLSAEQLTATLNQYHQLLSQAAKLYNGRVDRYLGDGIVMVFGVPGTATNACLHGLHAAQLFIGLTQYLREHGNPMTDIEFNIAAHFGPVLMAPLQNGQGAQCNLIGDTVHWASQLSQHADEHRILVSPDVIEHIDPSLPLRWSEGPIVQDLHGRQQTAFWLDSLPASTNNLIQRQIKHITSMTEKV